MISQNHPFQASEVSKALAFVKDVEAARLLGCSVSKLRSDRFHCRGIAFHRFGRSILYKISDLAEYMEKARVVPGEKF